MNKKTLTLYEFDEFRLDARQKCLWHADEMVSLTPKAFETLLVLIKHRGEIVGKDVLLDEVWADTFVEESTLAQNILTLRKTLGTFEKEKQFIVTVPRRGYRFVAEVKEISDGEEVFVVEKHTRTRIVAEQIHDSLESAESEIVPVAKPSTKKSLTANVFTLGAVLLGALILTAVFFELRYLWTAPKFAETKFQKFNVNTLFSSADIQRAVISPNGKYLALIEKKGDGESLTLRNIAESNSLEIIPKFDGHFIDVTFSPESDYLFYAVYPRTESNTREGHLYKIPILGGASQPIIRDIDSSAAISPDGEKIAFIRRSPQEKETVLITADADGKNEQKLAVRPFGEGFQNAAFSPDGKFISCAAFSKTTPDNSMEIIIVDAESGAQKSLAPVNWSWIGQTVWLKDGSGMALVAYPTKSPNLTDEVWFVSYPEGRARLLENGINGVFGISLTADSNSIVTVKSNKITSFAVSSLNDLEKPVTLLTKSGDEGLLPLGADWMTDEKIVYSTIQNGNADIWTINAGGGGQKQLTSDANADASPKAVSDGNSIYFLSNRTGLMSVWRMNPDGSNPQKLTENQDVFSLNVSPDGHSVFYTVRAQNIYTQLLWRISDDGTGARQLTSKTTILPEISPDGQFIACYFPEANGGNLKLTVLLAETGKVQKQIETPAGEGLGLFDWENDGQNLLLAVKQNETTTLWRQPLNEKPATRLIDWPNASVFRLAVSKDGRKVFYEKGATANSVLLLRDISVGN